jgi:putative restriction endonuclease
VKPIRLLDRTMRARSGGIRSWEQSPLAALVAQDGLAGDSQAGLVASLWFGDDTSIDLTEGMLTGINISGHGGVCMIDEVVLRQRVMARLAERAAHNGGFLSRGELTRFPIDPGVTRRLIDASKGIWNPHDLVATLSVVSAPDGPYDDREVQGGLFRYSYRAGSISGDNTKLRRAHELELPIILLRKIAPGVFVPIFPVYVIADDPTAREFVFAIDESLRFLSNPLDPSADERRYAEQVVRRRLHQPEFRARVVRAYDARCAICALEIGELLDAAHIVPDTHELGQPVVQNGLSLCKIHHAAYDRDLLGITSELEVRLNAALLDMADGPMLQHGLQEMHGRGLTLPRRRIDYPDPKRIDLRFHQFLEIEAGTTAHQEYRT